MNKPETRTRVGIFGNRLKAFTLAEVLITLVVIGVIAAITVPTLMAHHRKTEAAGRIKKFYSNMSNTLRLAETNEGVPAQNWDFDRLTEEEFFNKYLAKYMSYNKAVVETRGHSSAYWDYTVYLNDGTIMGLGYDGSEAMCFYIDINGDKKPNEFGRDVFEIDLFKSSVLASRKDLHPFDPYKCQTCSRQEVIDKCKVDYYWGYCTQLLAMDSWEFKDDYPFRI